MVFMEGDAVNSQNLMGLDRIIIIVAFDTKLSWLLICLLPSSLLCPGSLSVTDIILLLSLFWRMITTAVENFKQ